MRERTYVTYGRTESGDDLPVLLWGAREPTRKEVETKYQELLPEEFEEVGFVIWKLDEAEWMR